LEAALSIENQQEQQDQVDQTVQDDDAAMMAGFNKVRGEPPAEGTPVNEESQTEQTAQPEAKPEQEESATTAAATTEPVKEEAKPEQAAEQKAEDDPIVPGIGLKASEVKTLLAKAASFDQTAIEEKLASRMFGKFGEMQRSINEKLKSAPTGAPMKVSADAFKRLKAEYGDDMAKILAEDLSEVLQAPAGTFTKDQVDSMVSERLAEVNAQTELKLLTIAHPDWREHRKAPEFAIWLSTLPADVAQEVRASQDSTFLAEAFRAHKAWKSAAIEAKTAADAAAAAAAAAKQKTEKRLEGGVTPNGITPPAPPPPTAESAMQDGFNRVRKR
jgi:hypothetical protein